MVPVGFEYQISGGERPQTYALDRAATGTGNGHVLDPSNNFFLGATAPGGPGLPHSRGFLDHTQRRNTVGKTPMDE